MIAPITLLGSHPYFPDLGQQAIAVPLHDVVPGTVLSSLNGIPVDRFRDPEAWTPLAGPYRLQEEVTHGDRRALFSILWDLTGQPLHPGKGKRMPVEFALVKKSEQVTIWRRTTDMKFCRTEPAA